SATLASGLVMPADNKQKDIFIQEALMYYASGRYETAAQKAKSVLLLDKGNVNMQMLMLMSEAQIALTQKDYVSAQKLLEEAVIVDPDNIEAVKLYRRITDLLELDQGGDAHEKKQ
ncbi:MAG: tetratricopeptide repeat protein, partial [Elusimicrobiota bacterium]